jgi:hypothetical protein
MAQPRQILRNLMASVDGLLVFQGFNQFEVTLSREALEHQCLEEIGKFVDKGDWSSSAKLTEGYGIELERAFFERLAADEEESDLLLLLRSDTRLSPMAVAGDPALFFVTRTTEVPTKGDQGQIKRLSATFEPSDGRQPNLGVVLYTSRAKVPAPLTAADSPVVSVPVELGELVEGFELALTVHCHRITGTGDVTVEVEILSDVDDTFATATVQAAFALLFTNESPAPGGSVLAPKAQTMVLDGDVDTIPGEPAWAVQITIVDSDTDGEVEITVAANLIPK